MNIHLRTFAWELWYESVRCLSLETIRFGFSFGHFRLGVFLSEVSAESSRVGTVVWESFLELSLGSVSSEDLA